jgi:hypothetical protein
VTGHRGAEVDTDMSQGGWWQGSGLPFLGLGQQEAGWW